jgi:MFS family permease
MSDTEAIGVYIFYNLVYAVFSYPLGRLGDRIGLKRIFTSGLVAFAMVYFGMAFCNDVYLFFILFLAYGIYTAATDGISKAWISNITDRKDTATAIGTYTAFQSICTLIASSAAGFIWFRFGATALFVTVGVTTLFIISYFIIVVNNTDGAPKQAREKASRKVPRQGAPVF